MYRDQNQYRANSPGLQADAAERPESYSIPIPAESIGCQDLVSEAKCTHCGWLRKYSFRAKLIKILSWPQAYAVLNDGCFYYFKRETAKSPSGKFSLYGYNSVFRASDIPSKEAPWAFKIVHAHKEFKTYYFAASSEKEMKVWMRVIKSEMLKANGKSVKKNEDKYDEATFFKEVEASVYDDANKFLVTKDYTKKCSIKREDDDSDDEDLCLNINPTIGKRPPQPLPTPTPTPPPRTETDDGPLKPPRALDVVQGRLQDDPPPTPPRNRSKENINTAVTSGSLPSAGFQVSPQEIASQFASLGNKTSQLKKRKPSYVKTDGPGYKSPTLSRRAAEQPDKTSVRSHREPLVLSGGGGSTGEEDETEEYWAAIHCDDSDKLRSHNIIQTLCDPGVYLVRPEASGSGKVLVVYAENQTKKYRIHKDNDDQYYLAKEGYRHQCLEEMLIHYYDNDLPTVSQKLTLPFKKHPNYKDLHL